MIRIANEYWRGELPFTRRGGRARSDRGVAELRPPGSVLCRGNPDSARVSCVGERVSRSRTSSGPSTTTKDRFGETPKPARETRALPKRAFHRNALQLPTNRQRALHLSHRAIPGRMCQTPFFSGSLPHE